MNLKLKSLKSSGTFDYVDAPETSDSSPEGTQLFSYLFGVVVVEVWGWGWDGEVNLNLKSLKSSGTFDYVDARETSNSSPEGTQLFSYFGWEGGGGGGGGGGS